jgi:hypothetical protein
MMPLAVRLAAEGDLDEQVLRRLLADVGRPFAPGVCYGKHGRDHLRQNLPRFNHAARHCPFVVLADLETDECPPVLIRAWLPDGGHSNLLLRIPVRMVESWLLADQDGLANFLGIPSSWIPSQPDLVEHPKRLVVQIARRSRFRTIREDLVPAPGSTSYVGKNYVAQMIRFVLTRWQTQEARRHSPSLDRALNALAHFTPILPD